MSSQNHSFRIALQSVEQEWDRRYSEAVDGPVENFDRFNTPMKWAELIGRQVSKLISGGATDEPVKFRKMMVDIATTALAAIEAQDVLR